MTKDKVEMILEDVNGSQEQADVVNPEFAEAKSKFKEKISLWKFLFSENRWRILSRKNIRDATDRATSEAKVHFEKRVRAIENAYEEKVSKAEATSVPYVMDEDEALIEKAFYESENTFIAKAVEESMESIGYKKLKKGVKKGKKRQELEVALRKSFGGMVGIGLGFGAVEFGHEQILAIQRSCRLRYKMDGHFFAIVDNFKSYIIGRGLKFKVGVPAIQEALEKKYWEFNDMEIEQNDYVINMLIDGERFSRYAEADPVETEDSKDDEDTKKNFVVLDITPTEITGAEIVENKFPAYWLRTGIDSRGKEFDIWYKSSLFDRIEARGLKPEKDQDTEGSDAQTVYQMKFGGDVRGFPPFARILRVLRYYEMFINDVRRLYHEQSKIILVKYIPKGFRGFDKPLSQSVKGGVILKGIKDVVDYEFKAPQQSRGPIEAIGRLMRLTTAAGSRMPEFIAFMDGNTAVYASVKKMENPFSNAVVDYQDAFKNFFDQEVRIFLAWAIKNDILEKEYEMEVFEEEAIEQAFNILVHAINEKGEVLEASLAVVGALEGKSKKVKVDTLTIPIDWIFPDMVSDEPLQIAQRMKVLLESRIISRQTASTQAGFNWKLEVLRMAKEALMASEEDKRRDEEEKNLIDQGREGETKNFGHSELEM